MNVWFKRVFILYGSCLFLVIMLLWNYTYFCGWHFEDSKTRFLLIGDPQIQGDSRVSNDGFYGQVDVWYNDLYFRHIVDSLLYSLQPSHVFVLGDLFSSQYISNAEFADRVERYFWIFKNVKVPFVNIVGNHDIGYSADITTHRIDRFEKAFGKVDDIFIIENHLVAVVNSMSLEPSRHQEPVDIAWDNLERLASLALNTSMPVLIMKHIPLLKEDFDFTSFHFRNLFAKERKRELCAERAASEFDSLGHVKWQNMMSENATKYILEEIKPLFIFNGHDHDGCIYRHNEHTVEYTLRSIMGDFGGYVALFEILPTKTKKGETEMEEMEEIETYEYFYTPCPFVHLSVVTVTAISTAIWILLLISFVCYRLLGRSSNKLKVP